MPGIFDQKKKMSQLPKRCTYQATFFCYRYNLKLFSKDNLLKTASIFGNSINF
jgi:hypothetical protein